MQQRHPCTRWCSAIVRPRRCDAFSIFAKEEGELFHDQCVMQPASRRIRALLTESYRSPPSPALHHDDSQVFPGVAQFPD